MSDFPFPEPGDTFVIVWPPDEALCRVMFGLLEPEVSPAVPLPETFIPKTDQPHLILTERQMHWMQRLAWDRYPTQHRDPDVKWSAASGWKREVHTLLRECLGSMRERNRRAHRLTVFLGSDLRISGQVDCPYDDLGKDRPCVTYVESPMNLPDFDDDEAEDVWRDEWEDREGIHWPYERTDDCWVKMMVAEGLTDEFVVFEPSDKVKVTNPLEVHYGNDGAYDESILRLWPARKVETLKWCERDTNGDLDCGQPGCPNPQCGPGRHSVSCICDGRGILPDGMTFRKCPGPKTRRWVTCGKCLLYIQEGREHLCPKTRVKEEAWG